MVAYPAVFVGYFSTTSLSYPGYYQCNTPNYTPLKLYLGRFQNLPESTPGSFYIIPLGRSWGLPESTPTSQDLPPFRHLVKCLRIPESSPPFSKCICATLPESIPPSQNTPLFSTTILCNPPRMYPSLPEYTPLFNTYMWYSQNLPLPPRIYPPFSTTRIIMRRSQNLPLPPRIYPLFNKFKCATLPESTPPSQNITPTPF